MKLHRLLAYKTYQRFDRLKHEHELLKIEHGSAGSLGMLQSLFERFHPPVKVETIEQFTGGAEKNRDAADLEQLFTSYGSDKSTTHNNHFIYEYVLRGKRHEPLHLLEIGLGTNHSDVPSNMGVDGKPGASLRAFRDWAPKATVTGADVDKRVLFSEERISTCFVDQLDPATLRELASRFQPRSLDLVIDDGLHTPEANLNFLNVAVDLVKENGWIVIEDVDGKHLPFWSFVSWAIQPRFEFHFVKTRHACVVVLKKLASR